MKQVFFLSLFVLLGCAPTLDHTQIKDVARNIYVGDGVDKIEAILLAQDFIIRKSFYDRFNSLEPFRVIERVAFFKKGKPIVYVVPPGDRTGIVRQRTWTLYFRDKEHTFIISRPTVVPFKVIIDADTGKVINWGMDELREDPDIYSYEKIYEGSQI